MPLRDVRVLDASDTVAGQFASRLFADHGAHVVLLEPGTGSPLRTTGPTVPAAGHSLLFEHLNGGKQSVIAELSGPLVASFDVVIVSSRDRATAVEAMGVPVALGVVDDFATGGCYDAWRGSELVHQALSGSMFYTGLAEAPPLYGAGRRASFAAGAQLFVGLAAVVLDAIATGSTGRRVDVSIHEAAAAMEQNFSTQYSYNGSFPQRGEKLRPRGYVRCRDGWLVYFVRGGQWAAFCEVFDTPELIDDPRFTDWTSLVQHWVEAEEALQKRASAMSVGEVFDRARRRHLVLAPLLTLQQLWNEPHLRERGYWQDVDGPVPLALGPMFRFAGTAARRDRPAPELGSTPVAAVTGLPRRTAVATIAAARPPLAGIRILDLTSAWAGPMATRLLRALGADVIKVEGPARPDPWRGEVFDPPGDYPYPDEDPGARPFERHAWFNAQNQDKRSIVIDLKQPAGLELARGLVAHADVVIANWSPGALDRAGLGPAAVAEINPRAIVVEMPAISASGELADIRGLGPTMEAMTGIGQLIGYPPDRPLGSGSAYLDPTGAVHGAAAVVLALLHRELTGSALAVEVPQREAAMHWIGDLILHAALTGSDPGPVGSQSDDAAPFGPYPALGDDEWIAIEVEDDLEWHAFCDVVDPRLLDDVRFATRHDRISRRAELDAVVAEATRVWPKLQLADALQRRRVRAAPVQNGRDLFFDPHLRAVGWFTTLDHPQAGRHEYPGLPLRIDGARPRPQRSAPCFGEHAAEVLAELLAVDATELARLFEQEVVVDHPRGRGGM